MLSRGASNASTRLRRSKSSASANRQRNETLVKYSLDPETARRDAMTAAQIAMERASERASAEMRRSSELSRNQSNGSRAGVGATPRSQNIRFTDNVEPHTERPASQPKTFTIASPTYMPGSHSHSQLSDASRGAPLNEFGIADGYGSTPSSYRKLRKTKSMLTPRKRGFGAQDLSLQSHGTPPTLRNAKSSIGDHDHGLRLGLKRSMSFLKLSSGNLSKTFKRSHSASEQTDAAVERANEQFVQDVEQQLLQKRPLFLSSQRIRRPKAFRKTVRPRKRSGFGDGVSSEHHSAKQESKLRSFSASLRERVKRVLRKSPSKDSNLPAQHLDASRAHFKDYLSGTEGQVSHAEYLPDDQQSGSRGSLYVPSAPNEESVHDLEAISTCLRSMHSSDSLQSNGRSRVTSWTNSTMTNSLPGRSTPIERNRLSIIQEHGGPHQPSSSIGRHMDEISATHLPLSARHSNGQATTPIDSQRVYSALIKRMDQEQEEQDGGKTPKVRPFQEHRQDYMSSGCTFQTAPTIRQVASDESIPISARHDSHHGPNLSAPSRHKTEGQTPQQLAQENEMVGKRACRMALPGATSSFSPFPNENKARTPNPSKLTLPAPHEQETSSEGETGSVIISRPTQGENGLETGSESQYSRTTSGPRLVAGMNHSDPEIGDEAADMTTIIPNRVYHYPRPSSSLAQLHKARSNATIEWKSWVSSQITDLESRTSHYREGAQIHGDDGAVGARIGSAAGLGRRASSVGRGNDGEAVNNDERRASLMTDRFPLLELKEASGNNPPKPRRSSSLTKLASSAAADMKRASLTALNLGVNNENARMGSSGGASSSILRSKYSQTSVQGVQEPVSTPGKSQHPDAAPSEGRKLAKAQSVMAIGSHHPHPGSSAADDDDQHPDAQWHGDQVTTSRLSRPYIENGYGASSRASLAPSPPSRCYVGDENGIEGGGDTALPQMTAARSVEKRRDYRLGIAMAGNSKRMVSNFLRSRRRNSGAGMKLVEEGERGESPAFV